MEAVRRTEELVGESAGSVVQRSIQPDERSGVLHPTNLERYGARWFAPADDVAPVVDRYWHVRWNLEVGEQINQRIIELPAVTLSIEEGAVPAPLVVTGVQNRAWTRQIIRSGSVFGIRLRPAGLAVVSDLAPNQIADATTPVTRRLDLRLHTLLRRIAAESTPESRVRAADESIGEYLADRPLGPERRLANSVLDDLSAHIRSRIGFDLSDRHGVSARTIQMALNSTLGHGPKWVSRRIRLQEVARLLALEPDLNLAQLAIDLGYTDQAHLTNDFRDVAGVTPGAYRMSLLESGS